MTRTLAQHKAWRALSPYHRRLIMAERPDPFEEDESARTGALRDLESEFGSRQWDATVAILAEGEDWGDTETEAKTEGDAMCLDEIGREFGVSKSRASQIVEGALAKLRKLGWMQKLESGEPLALRDLHQVIGAIDLRRVRIAQLRAMKGGAA